MRLVAWCTVTVQSADNFVLGESLINVRDLTIDCNFHRETS